MPAMLLKASAAALACSIVVSAQAPQRPPGFSERVDVARIIVDARVVDGASYPVLGLRADDFSVKIDGKPARVDSAAWVGGDGQPDRKPLDSLRTVDSTQSPREGRLIVFLFQKSLEPSRIIGLMRMLREGREFLNTLSPNDRVAILSFDSHLTIWTDFTNDRARLDPVLERGLLLERPPAVQAATRLSLVERLAPAKGRRMYSIEKTLQVVAEALEPLPGPKSIVLFGYGMGRLGWGGVTMEHDYDPARRALLAARASVFSLDVTDADYHSLEVGLQLVSEETGGFYARTHLFPALAMRRLGGALAGSYVLFVEKPESRRRTHTIEVELSRRKGTVMARNSYEG
jgi:VWFA-related protein